MSDEIEDEEMPEEKSAFIAWLREDQGGGTLLELDEALKDVIQGIANPRSSHKGSVTLKVQINQSGPTVTTLAEVVSKIPKEPRVADVFYPDRDGRLHQEDPNRPKLDFTNVVKLESAGDVQRVADTSTGEIHRVEGNQP
jgi:hypothetical protein